MKNATSLPRWPCLLQDVLYQTFTVQSQTGSSSTSENHHPSFLRFWNWAEEIVDAAKICGGAENVVVIETQQTFVNGLLKVYYFRAFILRWKRALLTIIGRVAHRYGTYLHCSLIYFWVPSSCFCIVIVAFSEGEIIPFSGVCQSGGGCIIHAGGGFTH